MAAERVEFADERLVGKFRKSKHEEIFGTLNTVEGELRADVRMFATRTGRLRATPKGINIPADQLPALRELVDAMIEAAAE